ncbi:hypothetical protein IAT38_005743 [Cryptococcus sp. DSM 104549]
MRPSTSLRPLLSSSRIVFTPSPLPLPLLRTLHSTPAVLLPPKKNKHVTDKPVRVDHTPVYPAVANPFAPKPKEASKLPINLEGLVLRVDKLLGYNGRRRTTTREAGRMVAGIVQAVKNDKKFWYEECNLPATFHTFFSVHIVYVIMTLIRLRALSNDIPNPLSPLPEPFLPSDPSYTTPPPSGPSLRDRWDALTSAPHDFKYREMLLTHFFNIVESEIRLMLGAEITRDSAIKSRMIEYSNRWRVAQLGMDYALGLTASPDPAERGRADAELASWVWRTVYGRRGTGEKGEGDLSFPEGDSLDPKQEMKMMGQIELIVRFIRREQLRLANIDDRAVIAGNVGMFGPVRI